MLKILLEEQKDNNQCQEAQKVNDTVMPIMYYVVWYLFCLVFKNDSVTIQHISLAIGSVYNNCATNRIEELPLQQKATIATLVVMSHQKENHVTLEKVLTYIIINSDQLYAMFDKGTA